MAAQNPTPQQYGAAVQAVPFVLSSFTQVKKGLSWNWPFLTLAAAWRHWYSGDLTNLPGLQGQATVSNGLAFLRRLRVNYNYFKLCSNTYWTGALTELPLLMPLPTAQQYDTIIDAIRAAVRDWSITSRMCLVIRRGVLERIAPEHVFPVIDPARGPKPIGFVIAIPYVYDPNTLGPNSTVAADRLRVSFLELDNESQVAAGELYDFKLEGITLGDATALGAADISSILYYDDETALYPDIEGLNSQLIIGLSAMYLMGNRSVPAHLTTPSEYGDETIGDALQTDGSTLPMDDEGRAPAWLQFSPTTDLTALRINETKKLISQAAGLPPALLGIDVGAAESGVAREQLMYVPEARVSAMRRKLELGLKPMLNLDAVRWYGRPFDTLAARQMTIAQMYQAGILGLQETRYALGNYAPIPEDLISQAIPVTPTATTQQVRENDR